jgi:hypothetical protein
MTPKAQATKAKINGLYKTKNLLHSKGTINKMKRQPTVWEKIQANHASDKGLISKMHKELIKLHGKKSNNMGFCGTGI